MTPLSILDLAPIPEGSDAGAALRNTLDLARHAERLGYRRYWLAEHHNMPGIASAATAVVIGHVAAGTTTIRVGAGGIMLPNHAPLMIAEQFGTLAALYPGRIDLGLGRAPGTDHGDGAGAPPQRSPAASTASRRTWSSCMAYFEPAEPGQRVRAVPGAGSTCRSGSSARASSAPSSRPSSACPTPSPRTSRRADWRRRSRSTARASGPRSGSPSPTSCSALNVFAADTDDEARRLFTSLQQAFVNLRTRPAGQLPPPVDDFGDGLDRPQPRHPRPGARLRGRRLARDGPARASPPSPPGPAPTN